MKHFMWFFPVILFLQYFPAKSQNNRFSLLDSNVRSGDVCSINFNIFSHHFNAENLQTIDSLVSFLKTNPSIQIEIQIYSDVRGSDSYNDTLTSKISKSIRDDVINNTGIDSRRVIANGYGERFPVIVTKEIDEKYPFLAVGETLTQTYVSTISDQKNQEIAYGLNRRFLLRIISTKFSPDPIKMSVMTFNIRYNNPSDSENSWDNRKEAMVQLFNHYHPEIFGIQEGLYEQVTYLHDHLKTYDFIGAGREDGKIKGEFAAIFYDTTVFELIKQSTFWLSETPDTVSVGWDAALERICTYGLFRHKISGKFIMVFNTHFDHVGVVARTESARLLVRAATGLTHDQIAVVLMGDFNCGPESEAFQIIKSKYPEASGVSQTPLYGPAGTFNNFNPSNDVKERIDFVFVSKLRVLSVTHIDDKRNNNRVISDHYPVMVEIEF